MRIYFLLCVLLNLPIAVFSKTVAYELTATKQTINLSGKTSVDFALSINGSIPAPTLEFVEGDEAVIRVINKIPGQELSIHWHGILLPPEMDGVPYVTTPPIRSGGELTFRYKLRQSGTYWYHSHTNVQEQKGVYGAIVIHPKKKRYAVDEDRVIVLSDWSDEDALSILGNLRKDGDYYLYKKGTMRSWLGALLVGSLGNFLYNEWTRMGGMDYSDVGYDAFLIDGKRTSQLSHAAKGSKVRLRIVNAAASTYFTLALGQQKMRVISADGIDVEPIDAKQILIGMAETYDVLFELPENRSYEFRATAQDGTGHANTWIGVGAQETAPLIPFPDMYARMDHGHTIHSDPGSHQAHQAQQSHQAHESVHTEHHHTQADVSIPTVETLSVDDLRSMEPSEFDSEKIRELKLVLNGDMTRYVWHINGKSIQEDRTIPIEEGEVIRFVFENHSMMHHPMHLHGHFFRVINKNGDRSPLKHTVDVPPHGSRKIEFVADEPGEWMLHCHNLYHLKTGMARVIGYRGYRPRPEIAQLQKHDPHMHEHWYPYAMLEAATNHGQARFRTSNTWTEWDLRAETRRDWSWGGEGDLLVRKWQNRYFNYFFGATGVDQQVRAVAGVSYLLPMLVRAEIFLDHRAELRIDFEKRFQWTKTIFTDVDVTLRQRQDSEFEISLMYSPEWAWAAGVKYTGESTGVALQLQL